MYNLLLFLILFAEVVLFTYLDKKVFGNYFSPVVILSYPLLFIVALAMAIAVPLGFKPVSSSLLMLCIFGMLCFWSGSFFWSVIIPSKVLHKIVNRFSHPKAELSKMMRTGIMIFTWLVIGYMLFSFYTVFRGLANISDIGTDQFAYSYGGSGIAGHLLGISIPLMIFWIGIVRKRDYLIILTIAFLVFIALLYQVKTWLYIPLIGGVLLRFYNKGKIRFNPVYIIGAVAIVMVLFGLTYSFSVHADNTTFVDKLELLLNHFTGYVFAGVLGFGEHINTHMPVGEHPEVLFMPFINLYNFFTGHEVTGVVSPYLVFIDEKSLVSVNVKTFFGTIFVNGGYIVGIIYTVALSIFFYFLWIVSSITKNYWFIVLYIFFVSALVIGWFDIYYNQLPFVELPAYMALLIFFTNRKQKAA